jgi:Transposase DDE domain
MGCVINPDCRKGLPMTTVPQLARTLQTLFTTTAEQLARQTGFVRRASKLTGAVFAQTVVFTWLADPNATLETMAQTAAGLGAPITPQGLDERFHPAAARFLESLLARAMTQVVTADPVTIPLLRRFAGVYLQDSTVIRLPDALEGNWPGCGGSADSASQAAVKFFVRLDLTSGTLTRLVPQPARVSDSAMVVADEDLPPGSLRLADLGFFDIEEFRRLGQRGVFWLSRLLPAAKIYDTDGRELPLLGWLAKQRPGRLELPVLLGATQRLPCRLLVERVPDAVARKRRERLLKAARRKGTKVSAAKLALCAWTLYVTNTPAEKLTLAEALALGRARWQIELLFKLWKEHGRLDESRSGKPWRIIAEVFAKLLGLVVQHWALLLSCWSRAERSLRKAAPAVRHQALPLLYALASCRQLCRVLAIVVGSLKVAARINKSKKTLRTYRILEDPSLLDNFA